MVGRALRSGLQGRGGERRSRLETDTETETMVAAGFKDEPERWVGQLSYERVRRMDV